MDKAKICFVLFSICKYKKYSFDPMMLGVFLDKNEAEKAKHILKNSGNYISFVLELPLSTTSTEWINHAKDYIFKVTKQSFKDTKNDKVPVENKIIRRKRGERTSIKTISTSGDSMAQIT